MQQGAEGVKQRVMVVVLYILPGHQSPSPPDHPETRVEPIEWKGRVRPNLLLLHLRVGRGEKERDCQAAAATPNLDRLVSSPGELMTELLCLR